MKKLIDILKAAGEYCTMAAGVATIFISVAAAFVAFPVFVTFVVAAGIGVICGIVGGYHESQRIEQDAHQHQQKPITQTEIYKEIKLELDEIKQELEIHHESTASKTGPSTPQQLRIHFFAEPAEPEEKQTPCNEPVFRDAPSKAFN